MEAQERGARQRTGSPAAKTAKINRLRHNYVHATNHGEFSRNFKISRLEIPRVRVMRKKAV